MAIDVQTGVVAGTHERDTVVADIYRLVDKARRVQVPVVWVQHSDEQLVRGSDDWQIVPELPPGDGEWGAPPPDEIIAHTNLYGAPHTAPGRTVETVETKDVELGDSPATTRST